MLYKLFAFSSFIMGLNGNGHPGIDTFERIDDATSLVLPNEKSLPKNAPNGVKGIIELEFLAEHSVTRIFGEIRGLKANNAYGFHIHQSGSISAKSGVVDCGSAGGHYNPYFQKHGGPQSLERHAGDLGNIKANSHGVAKIDIKDSRIKLDGPQTVIGRSFVIHEGEDDLSPSSATGNSGQRLACGVIGIANKEQTTKPPVIDIVGPEVMGNQLQFCVRNNKLYLGANEHDSKPIIEDTGKDCRKWKNVDFNPHGNIKLATTINWKDNYLGSSLGNWGLTQNRHNPSVEFSFLYDKTSKKWTLINKENGKLLCTQKDKPNQKLVYKPIKEESWQKEAKIIQYDEAKPYSDAKAFCQHKGSKLASKNEIRDFLGHKCKGGRESWTPVSDQQKLWVQFGGCNGAEPATWKEGKDGPYKSHVSFERVIYCKAQQKIFIDNTKLDECKWQFEIKV